jgi:hypothetical protein
VLYKWRFRYKDNAGQQGPWSDYAALRVSDVPTATITAPANGGNATSGAPALTWTFGGAYGATQASYRIVLTKAGAPVLDTGTVLSAAGTYTIPRGTIVNGSTYSWTVTVTDSSGLSGSATATFTAVFTTPAALTGLVVTNDLPSSSIALVWNASVEAIFVGYYVERKLPGDSWKPLATITNKASPLYVDYEAPVGVAVSYRIYQRGTADVLDSPYTTASGRLASSQWWIATPANASLTFALLTAGWDSSAPLDQERYAALGRSKKLVVTGDLHGEEGGLTLNVLRADGATISKLRAISLSSTYVVLKSPFGEVFRVAIGEVGRTRLGGGAQTVKLTFVEIA